MAITNGNKYTFLFGTVAQYNAAKAANKIVADNLYFLTDSKQIYVGEDLYTGSVNFVESFPASPDQGVIYCNPTTHETKVWNGTAWQVIVPEVVSTIVASGQDATPNGSLANVGAIKAYVDAQIGDAYTITKQGTADTGYSATYQLFKGAVAVGDKINIPKDMVVESGSVKTATQEDVTAEIYPGVAVGDLYIDLVIANADDEHIYIPANSLVEFPTVADTATVDLSISSGHEITASVNISSTAGNALSAESDGLYVATVDPLVKSVTDTATVDLTVDATGDLTAAAIISSTEGNALTTDANGLFVAGPFVSSKDDTATVDITVSNGEITADVNVSADAGNILEAKADGLFVAPTWSQISAS